MTSTNLAKSNQEFRVLAVDEARARFLGLIHSGQGGLEEFDTLVDPQRHIRSGDMFTESRPGLRRGAKAYARHGVDDRRDSHRDEERRRFAQDVWERVTREPATAQRWIVVTGPTMLGALRAVSDGWRRGVHDLVVEEVEANICGLTLPEIQATLAERGLLPERARVLPTLR